MNREIKFRAWDKYRQRWDVFEPHWIFNEQSGIFTLIYNVEDDSMILMQFTGLFDKHGKEIYEGDILQVDWHDSRYPAHLIGPVSWNAEEACWMLGEGGSPKHDAKYYMEVIGNVIEFDEFSLHKNI